MSGFRPNGLLLGAPALIGRVLLGTATGGLLGGIAAVLDLKPWQNSYTLEFAFGEGLPFGVLSGFILSAVFAWPLRNHSLFRTWLQLSLATLAAPVAFAVLPGGGGEIFAWLGGVMGFIFAAGALIEHGQPIAK